MTFIIIIFIIIIIIINQFYTGKVFIFEKSQNCWGHFQDFCKIDYGMKIICSIIIIGQQEFIGPSYPNTFKSWKSWKQSTHRQMELMTNVFWKAQKISYYLKSLV